MSKLRTSSEYKLSKLFFSVLWNSCQQQLGDQSPFFHSPPQMFSLQDTRGHLLNKTMLPITECYHSEQIMKTIQEKQKMLLENIIIISGLVFGVKWKAFLHKSHWSWERMISWHQLGDFRKMEKHGQRSCSRKKHGKARQCKQANRWRAESQGTAVSEEVAEIGNPHLCRSYRPC